MADTTVEGDLEMGTQQQFLVRNSVLLGRTLVGRDRYAKPINYVYVGTEGAPDPNAPENRPMGRPAVTNVECATM